MKIKKLRAPGKYHAIGPRISIYGIPETDISLILIHAREKLEEIIVKREGKYDISVQESLIRLIKKMEDFMEEEPEGGGDELEIEDYL